jgi:hypothetical protein
MPDTQNSLILAEQDAAHAAPPLFPELAGEGYDLSDRAGEYSGDRLYAQRPETYRLIVRALGSGLGIRAIARTLGVSRNTVRAVRDREAPAIDPLIKETTTSLRRFARLAAERLIEEIDDIPLTALPIGMGIAVEKAQLLEGQATSRIERAAKEPSVEDVRSYLATLPGADAVVVPAIGLCGTLANKGSATGGPGLEAAAPAGSDLPIDSESIVSPATNPDDTVSDTGGQP